MSRTAGAEHDTTAAAGRGSLLVRPLTSTVPKEFVQRTSVAEVVLTGWERVGDHRFAVAAQWPRGHSLFAVDGRYHPLIAAETIRQTATLLAHAEYGVPLDRRLLVADIDVRTLPEHFDIDWTPATLELRVDTLATTGQGGALTGLRVTVEIHRDGQLAATGGALARVAPNAPAAPTAPAADRAPGTDRPAPGAAGLTPPVPPPAVGRRSPADVVLSAMAWPGRWLLRVDTGHPVFFDRHLDHTPDAMLLEASCQAAAMTLGRPCVPLDITAEFDRRTELTSTCVIEAWRIPGSGVDASESVLVTGHQGGGLVFRSVVTVAGD
ncbi:ScbA/BarX family gamma-butyrolactone biosynthesis protein [Streptomyces sp. NPDC050504]|uniref:ScbA/BarX family gamma-butyrolactone biosynthesis protein n=1 Tax=Streptomyces sp. NPDC050504 TaxID=3365618 RepID=UPI0037B62FEB